MSKNTRALEIATDLIRRPSVTPTDEGAQAVVEAVLKPLGFTIHHIEHEGIKNLWAEIGTAKPLVCFAGHTDVVPVGDVSKWTSHPFEPTIRNGMLYGRGASDMKGNIGCFLAAIERFVKTHGVPKNFSIGVMVAGDEEDTVNRGTLDVLAFLAGRGMRLDYCIVAEPTSTEFIGDTLKNGRRGSTTGFLTVRGIQGHSAYPHLARNPIHQALAPLKELIDTVWDEGTPDFPPTTLQIANITSGTGATNVIPGVLTANFNIRYSNLHSVETFSKKCGEIFAGHGLDCSIEWSGNALPFLTERGGLTDRAVRAVEKTLGRTPEISTTGGTSDARFIAGPGTEVIELGLVNRTIHAIDEHVSVESLNELTDVFAQFLEDFEG